MIRSRRPRREGAALVIVAGSLASLVALVALVVDIGYLYVLKARYQTVLDTAALGALSALDSSKTPEEQRPVVEAFARKLLGENGMNAAEYTLDYEASLPLGEIRLTINATRRTEAWFARVTGRTEFSVAMRTLAWARHGADGIVRVGLSP